MLGRFLRSFGARPGPAASYAELVNSAGDCKTRGLLDEARARLEHAAALEPGRYEAWYNLGLLLHEMRWFDEAREAFDRALDSLGEAPAPDVLEPAVMSAAQNLQASGEWLDARRLLETMAERHPELASACLRVALFTWVVAPDVTAEASLAAHCRWAARFTTTPSAPRHRAGRGSKLRIGYVSADLCAHAVSLFFEPVLAHHDTGSFEVYCYNSSRREDEVTARLRSWPATWREIADLGDDAVERLIREDAIDVLVDLSGHTAGNRLDVFARRPAPMQVTWLGYRTTTGMRAMDFRITDAVADPPGLSEGWYVERMIRLPDSQWCYGAPALEQDVGPLPMEDNGHVTFGSFNQFDKLHEGVIACWSTILQRIPGSKLLVARVPHGRRRESFKALWARHGVAPERLELHGYGSGEEFRALHRRADIGLDPFPCNGGATTCESLWMGVPVVTLAGAWGVARAGASLLGAAGLGDWVTGAEKDYIELAVSRASDPAALATLRRRLRGRLRASPLMDGARFTRALEAGLRQAWLETVRA